MYSQLSPCRHPTIMDTSIIQTAAKYWAKINYRHNKLLLLQTLANEDTKIIKVPSTKLIMLAPLHLGLPRLSNTPPKYSWVAS